MLRNSHRRKKIIILFLLRDCEAKIYKRSANHYWVVDDLEEPLLLFICHRCLCEMEQGVLNVLLLSDFLALSEEFLKNREITLKSRLRIPNSKPLLAVSRCRDDFIDVCLHPLSVECSAARP